MTVTIERIGGYAGIQQKLASVDSQNLPQAVADQLRSRLDGLSALTSRNAGHVSADQFHFEIEIEEPGVASQTISVFDEGNPDDPAIQAVMSILDLLGVTPQ